jgi:hypothetical protein
MPIEFQPETGKRKETQALYTIFYFWLAKIQPVQGTTDHSLHNCLVSIVLMKYIKIIFFLIFKNYF